MSVSPAKLVPPRDLLGQLEEIQPTLERSRVLGAVGWLAAALSAGQVLLVVLSSSWWSSLSALGFGGGWGPWLLLGAVVLFVVGFTFINWTRLWIHESRQPFRYTFSIEGFKPIGEAKPHPRMAWLDEDLGERLSRRIGRLSLLPHEAAEGETERQDRPRGRAARSHIHISGSYGVRDGGIEVFPRVQLGSEKEPATLAHPVRFALDEADGLDANAGASYKKLVEWVYFHVASHVYARIREDVEGKIKLLPRHYFRAAAYFYEASDYARSNTFDAYDAAQDLYAQVIRLYDPHWTDPPDSLLQRWLLAATARVAVLGLAWRRAACRVWPRLGKVELILARAESGYARALLDRRALAGFSGQRLNAVFEARRIAERAVDRLVGLSSAVAGCDRALFDARVTRAYAYSSLTAPARAEEALDEAQAANPALADRDARYLFVRGATVTRQAEQLFQRALELGNDFEAAQFAFARAIDARWRRRSTLEPAVAQVVIDAYDRVLDINPGNVAAWARQGYIYWLLEEPDNAEQALLRGREFKDMRPEIFVADLDYALARIAAERGNFDEAYRRYIAAVMAHFSEGVSHKPDGYTADQFQGISDAIVHRFKRYVENVEREWKAKRQSEKMRRLCDSVYAFVLNDYAEARMNHFLRTGDEWALNAAYEALNKANSRLETRYPMIRYNLQRLDRYSLLQLPGTLRDESLDWTHESPECADVAHLLTGSDVSADHIGRVLEQEPRWPDGMLELALRYPNLARQELERARRLEEAAVEYERRAQVETRGPVSTGVRFRHFDSTDQDRAKIASDPKWGPAGAGRPGQERLTQIGLPPLDPAQEADRRRRHYERCAKRSREAAKELRERAVERRQRAREQPKKLLPHAWLWNGDDLEVDVLKNVVYERCRKWEREFNDLHARALLSWCRIKREELQECSDADRHREKCKQLYDLLEHLQAHFWPDDLEVLSEWWSLAQREPDWPASAEEKKDHGRRLHDVVERLFEVDPAAWTLRLLEKDFVGAEKAERQAEEGLRGCLFTDQERAKLLKGAIDQRGVPPYLQIDLGSRLDRFGRRGAAEQAYGRLRRSRDPRVLWELAAELERGGHWDLRKQTLRRAELRDGHHEVRKEAEYARELGRTLWRLAEREQAIDEFRRAFGKDGDGRWRVDFVKEALALRRDSQLEIRLGAEGRYLYRLLKAWLGHDLRRAHDEGRPDIRRDAAAALLLLTRGRYHTLLHRWRDPDEANRSREPEELEQPKRKVEPAIATPIVLEADESFFSPAPTPTATPSESPPEPPEQEEHEATPGWSLAPPLTRVRDASFRVVRAVLGLEDPVHEPHHPQTTQAAGPAPAPSGGDGVPPEAKQLWDGIVSVLEAIEQETGIHIPIESVELLSTHGLGSGRYRLQIDEVPLAGETFSAEQRFFVLGHDELEGVPGLDPVTRRPGVWVAERPEDVPADDRYAFMCRRLHALLLANLDRFVTLWQTRLLLNTWVRRDPSGRAGIDAVYADELALVRLAQVLRRLAAERVSLEDVGPVAELVARAPDDADPVELAEQARRRLSAGSRLASEAPALAVFPPELENRLVGYIEGSNGTATAALRPGEFADVRAELEAWLEHVDASAPLVVLHSEARPSIRRFVALIDPMRSVVSREELPSLAILAGHLVTADGTNGT